VNSCTRSLNSVRSSCVGGTNPLGCLVEADLAMTRGMERCERVMLRAARERALDVTMQDMSMINFKDTPDY
jgi:hypothetical protein